MLLFVGVCCLYCSYNHFLVLWACNAYQRFYSCIHAAQQMLFTLTCMTISKSITRMKDARKARDSSLVETKSLLRESHLTKSVIIPVATMTVAIINTIQNRYMRVQPVFQIFRKRLFQFGYSLS